MLPIKCSQLFSYNNPEEIAVLEIASYNGRQGIYLVNGSGELIYKCEDAIVSEQNQSDLKVYLNSLSAIVVYDASKLKKNNIISAFLKNYQPMICDVGEQLAAFIGTWDIHKSGWLIRDLDEVLSFYRCEHDIKEPVERAKAILWLVEQLAESSSTELDIKREQKLKDYKKMHRYWLKVEGK